MLSEAHIASTSNSGLSKRNASKAVLPSEATNPGNGHGKRMGPSSSWISSLPRISSAKWCGNLSGTCFNHVLIVFFLICLTVYAVIVFWLICIVFLAVDLLKKIPAILSLKLQKCGDLMLGFPLRIRSRIFPWCIYGGWNMLPLMWYAALVPLLMPACVIFS